MGKPHKVKVWGEFQKPGAIEENPDGLWVTHSDYLVLQEAAKWLNEYVVEPEFFPNDGDRQFWHEKLKALRSMFV